MLWESHLCPREAEEQDPAAGIMVIRSLWAYVAYDTKSTQVPSFTHGWSFSLKVQQLLWLYISAVKVLRRRVGFYATFLYPKESQSTLQLPSLPLPIISTLYCSFLKKRLKRFLIHLFQPWFSRCAPYTIFLTSILW